MLTDWLQILERVFVPLEERPSIDEVATMIGVPVYRVAPVLFALNNAAELFDSGNAC